MLKPVGKYCSKTIMKGDSPGEIHFAVTSCRHSVRWHLLAYHNGVDRTVLQFIEFAF